VEFTITALNGESVKLDSDNWMTAMGKAFGFFDIDVSSLGKLSCSTARDGSVFVEDPVGNRSWMVRQRASDVAVRVTGRSQTERWEVAKPVVDTPPRPADRGAAPLPMPVETSLRSHSYLERVEQLQASMARTSRERACDSVLGAIEEFVRSEASSIAIGTLKDPALRFAAARGPRGRSVVGRQPGFGEGLVGMCFDMRGTLLVNDVASDTPHLDHLDHLPPALAALCVPLLDAEGEAYGVIQLINPPERPFTRAHVELVECFAHTLAGNLAARAVY
jgi:GAF domain